LLLRSLIVLKEGVTNNRNTTGHGGETGGRTRGPINRKKEVGGAAQKKLGGKKGGSSPAKTRPKGKRTTQNHR